MSRSISYRIPENWIREYLEPRYPELVSPFREAATITEAALRTQQLNESDLATLLSYATSSRAVLSDNVGDMLGKLANLFPAAQQALETMAQSKKVEERIQALLSALHLPPSPFHKRMYSTALKDRSKKVRSIAAQNIRTQAMAVLLPELAAAVDNESDQDTRQHLRFCQALLEHGYWLETKTPKTVQVTYCRNSAIASRTFSTEQFEVEGKTWLEQQAAEWKKRWYLS